MQRALASACAAAMSTQLHFTRPICITITIWATCLLSPVWYGVPPSGLTVCGQIILIARAILTPAFPAEAPTSRSPRRTPNVAVRNTFIE
eukprot:5805857-Pyramimonas_sp.AAC.1